MERRRPLRPRLLAGLVAVLTLGLLWAGGTSGREPGAAPDALRVLSVGAAGHEPVLLPVRHGGWPGYGRARGDRIDPTAGPLPGTERAPHPFAVAPLAVPFGLAAASAGTGHHRPHLALRSLAGPGRRAPPVPIT